MIFCILQIFGTLILVKETYNLNKINKLFKLNIHTLPILLLILAALVLVCFISYFHMLVYFAIGLFMLIFTISLSDAKLRIHQKILTYSFVFLFWPQSLIMFLVVSKLLNEINK